MDEMKEYLKISKSTIYKLVQDNKLSGQQIGERWQHDVPPPEEVIDTHNSGQVEL